MESIKHGNSALATKHLTMTSVEMTLDYLGLRSVKVHDENREMAIAIAKRVTLANIMGGRPRIQFLDIFLNLRDVPLQLLRSDVSHYRLKICCDHGR